MGKREKQFCAHAESERRGNTVATRGRGLHPEQGAAKARDARSRQKKEQTQTAMRNNTKIKHKEKQKKKEE